METIKFYTRRDPYFELSNFYQGSQFVAFGITWESSEHLYQALKFESTDKEAYWAIARAKTPAAAAKIGRDKNNKMRPDWDEVKDDLMYDVLYRKFTGDVLLKNVLINTKDAVLVEHSKKDSYWGDGGDGSGKNMLGELLMELRDDLNGFEK